MRLGIDLDGVTYPFNAVIVNYAEHVLGVRLPATDTWEMYLKWGLTDDEFRDLMREGCEQEAVFWEGAPLPGAVRSLDALWNDQHEIVLITHRGDYATAATETWLARWGIVYDELHFAAADKTTFGVDIMLDDSPSVIRTCRAAGIETVCFDQPWNHGQFEEPVAYSWDEFLGYVNT